VFVGGTIFRKGIDLLLAAFGRAFRPRDGVGLVIKEMGSKGFYDGQTAENAVRELAERGYSVEYIDRDLRFAKTSPGLGPWTPSKGGSGLHRAPSCRGCSP